MALRFVDEVEITVLSGKGGPGAVSFRHEKYVPKGGPDGGDGGDGGDVIIKASRRLKTLYDLKRRCIIKAKNGLPGRGKNKKGGKGKDRVIFVPCGTLVIDAESGNIMADLTEDGASFTAVRGGRGGLGNARFLTSTNRAPRYAQRGEQGQMTRLTLQLKIIADVGIIGLPNAGKSTLLSVLTNARPRIADYPFTTLSPNLGVMRYGNDKELILSDVPGLIEGASRGHGLGVQFLRHIERTRILLFLLDLSMKNLRCQYDMLVHELGEYSRALLDKPRIMVGSKSDLVISWDDEGILSESPEGRKLAISSITGEGLEELRRAIVFTVDVTYGESIS